MPILFFNEDIKFILKNKTKIRQWLDNVAAKENAKIEVIDFIFCSDNYLLKLNKKHLNHNTLTDIITFDNSIDPKSKKQKAKGSISGDIFISIERINENAENFNTTFENEINRVMVHGLLHLLGYKDKKPADKKLMTKKEDFYLSVFPIQKQG